MSATSSFANVLHGFLAVVAVAVFAAVMIKFAGRDGILFRTASKVIFPISKQFTSNVIPNASAPINEKLDRHPEGWKWFQSELATSTFDDKGLLMVPTRESVWWKNKRGPLFYTYFSDDFETSVTVSTRKKSIPGSYPDEAYQFGGLVIRDPRGAAWLSREEYVFIAVGYRGTGLQIESKSTFDGYSDVIGTDWESGDARLRIRRVGKQIELYAYSEKKNQWRLIHSFERELPRVVQVGLFSYAYSGGKGIVDIKAWFRDFQIQDVVSQAGDN